MAHAQQGNYAPGAPGVAAAAALKSRAATEARAASFLEREQVLDNAIHQGIISAGLRAHFATLWDADPVGTREHLESIGLARTTASATASSSEDYNDSALSRVERDRIAAARAGRTPRIIGGGL
jgi:hypothetical protein